MAFRRTIAVVLSAAAGLALVRASPAQAGTLQDALVQLAFGFDGRVGICARDSDAFDCVNGNVPFPLAGVSHVLVAVAAMDAVDTGKWKLDDVADGAHATVEDLIRRAIAGADNAASDALVAKLGGLAAVQSALDAKQLAGVSFDRATATPVGMGSLLQALAEGRLLSATSTTTLLKCMTETTAAPDRLKAGVSGGWTLAHVAGASAPARGVTPATNDVGILTAPDGRRVSIVVFIADSRASSVSRASVMVGAARSAIALSK